MMCENKVIIVVVVVVVVLQVVFLKKTIHIYKIVCCVLEFENSYLLFK